MGRYRYGSERFADMLNKPLSHINAEIDGGERVTFHFQDGSAAEFKVEGDCCSSSWVEYLELPVPDIAGVVILGVEDSAGIPWDGHVCRPDEESSYLKDCGHDHLQVYNTCFRTAVGDIKLEYRNDSNGYYGGSLVRVD